MQSVFDDVLGYGPIDQLLRDPGINEVMVNGPEKVFIEHEGKIVLTDVHASSTRATSAGSSTRS